MLSFRVVTGSRCFALVMFSVAASMQAQAQEEYGRSGFRLNNIAISGGYSSGVDESLSQGPGSRDMGAIGSVSAELGFDRIRRESELSVTYTPSYLRMQGSDGRSLTQSFSLSGKRRVGTHWQLLLSSWASDATLDQMLLAPAPASQTVPPPGQGSTSTPSGTDATVAPAAGTPSSGVVYGSRLLMANAQTGFAYTPNTRWTFRLAAGVTRQQSIANGNNTTITALIPRTTTGNAIAGINYALSPRTYVGLNSESMRVYSRLNNYYVFHNDGLIGKKLTRHWSGEVEGGVGLLTPTGGSVTGLKATTSSSFSGTIAYQARSHAFSAIAQKRAGDTYGFGARSSDSVSAGWTWNSQRDWAIYLLGAWERLQRDTNFESWQGYSGISRRLTRHTWLLAACAYLDSVHSAATGPGLRGWSARMSFVWSPGEQMNAAPR